MALHYFHWMLFLIFFYFVPPFPRFSLLFATLSKVSFTFCHPFQDFTHFLPHFPRFNLLCATFNLFTFCHPFQDFNHFVPHFPRFHLLCVISKASFTLCRLPLLSKLTFQCHLRCYYKAISSNSIFSSFQDNIFCAIFQ